MGGTIENTIGQEEEEKPPQGSTQTRDEDLNVLAEGEEEPSEDRAHEVTEAPEEETAPTEEMGGDPEGVNNPGLSNPEVEEVTPLQMEDFPGHTTSPLPVLTPPTEPPPAEEVVFLLEGPPNPNELQIIDPGNDSSPRNEEPEREKKRKGRLLARPGVEKDKKHKRRGDEEPAVEEQGQKDGQATDEDAQPQYGMFTVELDEEAILQLKRFDDPKLQEECEGRLTGGKRTKSGKLLHRQSLRDLGIEGRFLEYITGIGFEWLLESNDTHVPVALAQEFFTSFHFKSTTDVGERSISFRIFGRNVRMSLTEWSVRLGLYSEEEAMKGAWFGRDIGPPRSNVEYEPQAAWDSITHHRAPAYKATQSRGYHIADPVLRLAQIYLSYNLLGQANTSNTITSAELYFLWCMKERKKVHLGYWIAHTCHTIANHPVRHLNVCHLLGEFVRRNFRIIYRVPPPPRCPAPENFDIQFFIRVRILKEVKGELRFYEIGAPDTPFIFGALPTPRERDDTGPGTEQEKEGWKERVEAILGKLVESSLAQEENARAQRQLMEAQAAQLTKAVGSLEEMVGLLKDHLLSSRAASHQSPASSQRQPPARHHPRK